MITRIASRAGAFVGRVFPERQIYHRAEGQVRYFTLSTRAQVLTATASALAIGWFSYSTASVFLRGHLLSAQSTEAQQTRARYERWLAEARAREASALALLQTRTSDFEQAAQEFERRHRTLQDLLEHATGSREDGRGIRLAESENSEAVLMTAAVEDPTPRRSRLAIEAHDADEYDYLDNERVAEILSNQDRMLSAAEERSQDRVENLRAVLRLTGLSVENILDEGDRASGGPYVGLGGRGGFGVDRDFDDLFSSRVVRVAARVAEAERLERAIDATPLGAPVDAPYRLTSGYGPRIDPLNGQPSRHNGLDFAAHRLAPIVAAAPGRVTFVGWRSGFGQTVEIDHGHGFRTRYGHLNRAYVERGEEVSAGDRVGAMGSTGRSTGTHLHYEVWFRGRHYDPIEFLRAGRYVQQG